MVCFLFSFLSLPQLQDKHNTVGTVSKFKGICDKKKTIFYIFV